MALVLGWRRETDRSNKTAKITVKGDRNVADYQYLSVYSHRSGYSVLLTHKKPAFSPYPTLTIAF